MFETKSILETLLYKSFYFELQAFAVYFRSTYVYINIKTDIFSYRWCTCTQIQLIGNCQLLPSS